jgi:hypothetical protein
MQISLHVQIQTRVLFYRYTFWVAAHSNHLLPLMSYVADGLNHPDTVAAAAQVCVCLCVCV